MSILVKSVTGGLAVLLAVPVFVVTAMTSSDTGCLDLPGTLVSTPFTGVDPRIPWDTSQRAVAATIVAVGVAKNIPPRGQVIAVATAMQESGLRNLPGGDADSLGVFQQRPSQGWGSRAQLASPHYQAERFYEALLRVPGWQRLSLTDAAQAVQRSAYPDAYARWTAPAVALVRQIRPDTVLDASLASAAVPVVCRHGRSVVDLAEAGVPSLPPGTPPGAATAVMWALAQLGSPYSWGGDCTAPRSPDPARRCDCSSLVQQAFRAAGVSLPRTTYDQVRAGRAVASIDQLRPGDLIFTTGSHGTAAEPGHVGLYVTAGLVIHAPHTGASVTLSPLSQWASHIVGIRRLIP
jgi:cell wall-associated NlpC family hydrolase